MRDSRKKSFIESSVDVSAGFIISLAISITLLPMYVYEIENREIFGFLEISVVYTVFALLRKYGLRRLFEKFRTKI